MRKFCDLDPYYQCFMKGDLAREVCYACPYANTNRISDITICLLYTSPVTLESNVIQLHQELFGEEDYVPTQTVQTISDKIVNKTGYQ